jgi:hypothetical protein
MTGAAPATATSGTTSLVFSSWSDGGAAEHVVTIPASGGTMSAIYRAQDSSTLLTERFSSGLSGWAPVTNVSAASSSADGAYALASANRSPSLAQKRLPTDVTSACATVRVKPVNLGSDSPAVLKLRGANGRSIARVYLTPAGEVAVRADAAGSTLWTPRKIAVGSWSTLGLCATVGSKGALKLTVDGEVIGTWTRNNGSSPVRTVQLGDDDKKTFTVAVDDLVVTKG